MDARTRSLLIAVVLTCLVVVVVAAGAAYLRTQTAERSSGHSGHKAARALVPHAHFITEHYQLRKQGSI